MTDHTPAGRIIEALAEIRKFYDATLQPVHRGAGSHALTVVIAQPPITAATLDVRRRAYAALVYWTMVVVRGRKLHRTGKAGVPALTGFLTIHADWLATYAKAVADFERSATALTQIATDSVPHHVSPGPCPGTVNGNPCPGVIRATLRRDDDLLPSEMACDATPRHAWPAGEWKLLERRLHANASAARRLTASRERDIDRSAARTLASAILRE